MSGEESTSATGGGKTDGPGADETETDPSGDEETQERRPRRVRTRPSREAAVWEPVVAPDDESTDDQSTHSGEDTRPADDDDERSSLLRPEPGPRMVWDPATRSWRQPGEVGAEPEQTAERPGRSSFRAGIIGGVVGAVLAATLTTGGMAVLDRRPAAVERTLDPGVQAATGQGGIVEIAARSRPWVVNVRVTGRQRGIFGSQQFQGNGSGVIIRSDGHIITNAHVVEGASDVEVTLHTGRKVPAEVVGADADTDVAVIKVDGEELVPAVIGSAADLHVGETVVAIGSPLGLEQTVTSGIVSALSRTVDRPDSPPLVDMIQTDAAVTQGNSGGALIDAKGALVGINTAIAASPTVGAEGIAFAIPVDIAKAVADELIDSGRATHPWLGVSGTDLDPQTAQQFGVETGALIFEVVSGGPADAAGVRARDVIVSMNGTSIDGMQDLVVAIRQGKVGQQVTLEVVRDGNRVTLNATLGDKPQNL